MIVERLSRRTRPTTPCWCTGTPAQYGVQYFGRDYEAEDLCLDRSELPAGPPDRRATVTEWAVRHSPIEEERRPLTRSG